MPLVAHNPLPSFERLRSEGYLILSPERAVDQDIRSLHIGLLNMMPDAALEATERQFFRLVGSSNPISQFYIHPFTLDEIPREAKARAHIDRFYEPLDSIKAAGLDALIISGANVTRPNLQEEVFWSPLQDVIEWAEQNVTSTLCSCLATHAVLRARYDIHRRGLSEKCWGVFDHKVVRKDHPLVQDINTRVSVPHSRFNEVTEQQLVGKGLHVLLKGSEPGVQLAVSPDGFRTVFLQGHPEYDSISLMKEYKREIGNFVAGRSTQYPPVPKHFFDQYCLAILDEYRGRLLDAMKNKTDFPVFPEALIRPRLVNTWHDSGEALVGNWLGLVYQVTHASQSLPFMEGIDPADPLGWLAEGDLAT